MSHATPFISFISPATPPSGDKAEAVLSPSVIVSAIYSRPLAVYLRMSVFVQYAQRNLSHWLHALTLSLVSTIASWNLKENLVHELPRNSVIGAQIDE